YSSRNSCRLAASSSLSSNKSNVPSEGECSFHVRLFITRALFLSRSPEKSSAKSYRVAKTYRANMQSEIGRGRVSAAMQPLDVWSPTRFCANAPCPEISQVTLLVGLAFSNVK